MVPDIDFLPQHCLLRVNGIVLATVEMGRSRLAFLRQGDIVLSTHWHCHRRYGLQYHVIRRRGCLIDCYLTTGEPHVRTPNPHPHASVA